MALPNWDVANGVPIWPPFFSKIPGGICLAYVRDFWYDASTT
jgi:hypothetical protein